MESAIRKRDIEACSRRGLPTDISNFLEDSTKFVFPVEIEDLQRNRRGPILERESYGSCAT